VQEYSENFKRKMVQRMCGPHARSARSLSKEVGVSQAALSRWLLQARTIGTMTKKNDRDDTPVPVATRRERSAEEKLRLVLEAGRLSDDEVGAFLRREGLHEAELDEWRDAMVASLRPPGKSAPSRDARRVRELEKELRRKDKALAEAAALLVLQKKVQALWGDEDDDTKKESDE
jgi:transposase